MAPPLKFTTTLMAGELVLDQGLYPRTQVNAIHVGELADALRAGAEFPPVIVDRATRKVVDGFHRTSAVLRVHGPEGMVRVEERDYPDEIAMFLESVQLNTSHGLRLTPYDQTRVMTLARSLHVEESAIARVLSVPEERIMRLTARKVAVGPEGQAVALKGIAPHLRNREVSDTQIDAMKRASGMHLTFHANQIINAIRGDLVNRDSPAIMEKLVLLRDVLAEWLPSQKGVDA